MELFRSDEFKTIKEITGKTRKIVRNAIEKHLLEVEHDENKKFEEMDLFLNILRYLTRKWNLEILWELTTNEGLIFNDLMRRLKNISSRTLSDNLKSLQNMKLVNRNMQDTRPPTVLYELTDKGKGLVELALQIIYFLADKESLI